MNTQHTVGHVGWSPDYKSSPTPPVTGKLIARRSAAACSGSSETLAEKVAREHGEACREIQMYLCSLTKQFGEDGVPGDDVVKRVKKLGQKMAKFDKQLDAVFKRIDAAKSTLDGGCTFDDLANAVRRL